MDGRRHTDEVLLLTYKLSLEHDGNYIVVSRMSELELQLAYRELHTTFVNADAMLFLEEQFKKDRPNIDEMGVIERVGRCVLLSERASTGLPQPTRSYSVIFKNLGISFICAVQGDTLTFSRIVDDVMSVQFTLERCVETQVITKLHTA